MLIPAPRNGTSRPAPNVEAASRRTSIPTVWATFCHCIVYVSATNHGRGRPGDRHLAGDDEPLRPARTRAGRPALVQLPYTLNLPESERQRWRMHLDVSRVAGRLVCEQLGDELAGNGFLTDLLDARAQAIPGVTRQRRGHSGRSLPTGFAKAVTILEKAVRGLTIGGGFHRALGRAVPATSSSLPTLTRKS